MTKFNRRAFVVVRGCGEMASGVISVLSRKHYHVIALEQAEPWCVRRAVCFAEAVYDGLHTIDGLTAVRIESPDEVDRILDEGEIPVLIDPQADNLPRLEPLLALVDARMLKTVNDCSKDLAPIVIGLGPGFIAGDNCHAAIETNRGPNLGRVYRSKGPQAYTGNPSPVLGFTAERVIRASTDGKFTACREIGEFVAAGEQIGQIGDTVVVSPLAGVVRGMLRHGIQVARGRKIGDIDPRLNPARCFRISVKARSIGKGVWMAIDSLLTGQI